MRRRLLRIGLRRYEHWMLLMHGSSMYGGYRPDSPIDWLFPLSENTVSRSAVKVFYLHGFHEFLFQWATTLEPLIVESIVKSRGINVFDDFPVLLDSSEADEVKKRCGMHPGSKSWINDTNRIRTLVLRGGPSPSINTSSVLALAKRKQWMCVYMTAAYMFECAVNDESLPDNLRNDVKSLITFATTNEQMSVMCQGRAAAAAIVRSLISIVPLFKHPMQHNSDSKRKLVIIVDEAGAYPEFVRACSTYWFALMEPGFYTTNDPQRPKSLRDHLRVPGTVQLVVECSPDIGNLTDGDDTSFQSFERHSIA